MLRTHTYLSSSASALHCITFSRASKGPVRCRRWTFPSFPITGHQVGYAEFPYPLRATVHHNHIFLPRPLQHTSPQYLGLDVHLTNMPQLQTRSPTWRKDCTAVLCPLCFHAKLPAKLAFAPYPWASSSMLISCLDSVEIFGSWKPCQHVKWLSS